MPDSHRLTVQLDDASWNILNTLTSKDGFKNTDTTIQEALHCLFRESNLPAHAISTREFLQNENYSPDDFEE